MRLTGPDHIVLVSPDPERLVTWYAGELGLEVLRLEEWRRDEVPFVSFRVSPTFLIDVMRGPGRGDGGAARAVNVDHLAVVVEDVDLDQLAASGRFDVVFGPADLFGAQGMGRGLYVHDPDGNMIELRTY